jgi:hypothetical protein
MWGAAAGIAVNEFETNCTAIFNNVLSTAGVQAYTAGGALERSSDYLTIASDEGINATDLISGGPMGASNIAVSRVGNDTILYPHGLCFFHRSDTAIQPRKLFIAYDPYSGQFFNAISTDPADPQLL